MSSAGVEFIDENGGGPGVRLRKATEEISLSHGRMSCVRHREVSGEALAGGAVKVVFNPGCRRRIGRGRQHGRTRHLEVRFNPAWSETPVVPGCFPRRKRRKHWPVSLT